MRQYVLWVALAVTAIPSAKVSAAEVEETIWDGRHLAIESEDSAAIRKYKDFTPAEIFALPNGIHTEDLPRRFQDAAALAVLPVVGKFRLTRDLLTLMYPAVADFKSAVKMFQMDIGEEDTGDLTVWQIYHLTRRAAIVRVPDVMPYNANGFFHRISDDFGGYAKVEGAFQMHYDTPAYPVNSVEIECNRSEGYCEVTTTHIEFPKYHGSLLHQDPQILVHKPYKETFRIASWRDGIIETVPDAKLSRCRMTSLSLNFNTEEFFYFTRNGTGCEQLDRLETPRISQVVDGIEMQIDALRKFSRRNFFLNQDMKKRLEREMKRIEREPTEMKEWRELLEKGELSHEQKE